MDVPLIAITRLVFPSPDPDATSCLTGLPATEDVVMVFMVLASVVGVADLTEAIMVDVVEVDIIMTDVVQVDVVKVDNVDGVEVDVIVVSSCQ